MDRRTTDNLTDIIKHIADIIIAASKTILGFLSLLWISICIIAFCFFFEESVQVKLVIFFSLFVGVAFFARAAFSQSSTADPQPSTTISQPSTTEIKGQAIVLYLLFFVLFVGIAGFVCLYICIPPPGCSLHIESAEYITSQNRLVVKITGDASNVEDPKNWKLISTSNACNSGRIIQTNDGYEYVKEYCTLPQGAGVNFSYKMKDNKRCNATHEVQFN